MSDARCQPTFERVQESSRCLDVRGLDTGQELESALQILSFTDPR